MGNDYMLRYLPLFYEDLNAAVTYIAENLENPDAAMRLIDSVEEANARYNEILNYGLEDQ